MTKISFVRRHARPLERISLITMIAGLLFTCQPFFQVLFTWSVCVMLIGLVGYNVFARIESAEVPQDMVATGGGH